MAGCARVVCWANREEWIEIYECLYSFDNVERQRKGLDRVLAWKSRSGGKLPLAIESTADLILAFLADTDSSSFTTEVQLVVSMALVRFVNGMADLNQRGVYARSVQAIAEEIGLPDWLVDLRHEATHANLPSQDTLRAGVRVALSWLRNEYWEAQVKVHKDLELKVCSLIEKYQDVSTTRKTKKKDVVKHELKVKAFAEEIASFVGSNNLWSHLQTFLLNNGLLDTEIVNQESVPSHHLSEELIRIWSPLFTVLDKESPDFITLFIIAIIDSHSNSNMHTSNHSLLWVPWLIRSSTKSNPIFRAKLPWLTLLELCLKNPNCLLKESVSLILYETSLLQGAQKAKLKSLIGIYYGQESFNNGYPNKDYDCKSCEQLKIKEKLHVAAESMKEDAQFNNGWSAGGSQTKWSQISFGEILGCDTQSTNLLELPVFLHQKPNTSPNSSPGLPEDKAENVCKGKEENEIESESDSHSCHSDSMRDLGMDIDLEESIVKESEKLEICLF